MKYLSLTFILSLLVFSACNTAVEETIEAQEDAGTPAETTDLPKDAIEVEWFHSALDGQIELVWNEELADLVDARPTETDHIQVNSEFKDLIDDDLELDETGSSTLVLDNITMHEGPYGNIYYVDVVEVIE